MSRTLDLILLLSMLSWALGETLNSGLHCAMRREISPCTCKHQEERPGSIQVSCEKMSSFMQVVAALKDRFEEDVTIALTVSYSQLEDLPLLSFQKLGLNVYNLKLNHDNLNALPETVFLGLGRTEYLSMADNSMTSVPYHILRLMPIIKTLDMGRCKIASLNSGDFQNLPLLRSLILPSNAVSRMDNNTFPKSLRKLHLARNSLTSLNGTLKNLEGLEWLFINENHLTHIDGELPEYIPNTKLALLDISYNQLERLPQDLRNFQALNALYADHNQIKTLHGALSKSRKLERLHLEQNSLNMLAPDDFAEAESLEFLKISYNKLVSLNSSLLPLRSLRLLNLSHNLLEEFSLQDIRGLRHLAIIDVSFNKITRLGGRMENLVELETRVIELRLDNNKLQDLSGALMGLTSLQRLNLSFNKLNHISPDDFIGLDNLKSLDISHNSLTTLEETSKTFLPSLDELIATHNQLIALERDFHGLPVLCLADLSYNQIRTISKELVEKTQCQLHGVNRTLNIYLNENPVLCDDDMMATIKIMEERNTTKVYGKVDCMVEVNNTVPIAMPMMPLIA